MFSIVEGQDSGHPFLDPLLLFISEAYSMPYSHTHKISGTRHNDLPVSSMKDSRSWSHMSTRTAEGTYLKNFCRSVQKQRLEEKINKELMTT